jgi:hypothetical protein
LHIVDARCDLGRWEVIAKAEHRCQPSRYHSCKLSTDNLIDLTMVASAFRVTHDDGRGDSDEVICRSLASECPGTLE